jgi:hypothetical protein
LRKIEQSQWPATATVPRVIGGHPRVLEFLDVLLRGARRAFQPSPKSFAALLMT